MTNEAEKREAIRLLRGSIVRALQRVLTTGTRATIGYLMRVCRPEDEAALLEAMAYLVASGRVERNESRLDAGDKNPLVTYKLTAQGISLAERTVEDPNVIMD